MTTFAEPMVHDELESVVSSLCSRYPARERSEIEGVVAGVYADLVAHAMVTTHLIPLTLNRSRRLLALESPDGGRESEPTLRRVK